MTPTTQGVIVLIVFLVAFFLLGRDLLKDWPESDEAFYERLKRGRRKP